MVEETCESAPARIASQFDESCPEHHPEEQPAEEDKGKEGRRGIRRPEEGGQKPGFQQNGLPAEGVESLPHIHERKVEQPEGSPDAHRDAAPEPFRESDKRREGKRHAEPAVRGKGGILWQPVKDARHLPERDLRDELRHRKKASLTKEGVELVEHRQKGGKIDERQGSLEEQAGEPVAAYLHRICQKVGELGHSCKRKGKSMPDSYLQAILMTS